MPFSVLGHSRRVSPFSFSFNLVVGLDFPELVHVVVFTQACYFSASQISYQFACFELRTEGRPFKGHYQVFWV